MVEINDDRQILPQRVSYSPYSGTCTATAPPLLRGTRSPKEACTAIIGQFFIHTDQCISRQMLLSLL